MKYCSIFYSILFFVASAFTQGANDFITLPGTCQHLADKNFAEKLVNKMKQDPTISGMRVNFLTNNSQQPPVTAFEYIVQRNDGRGPSTLTVVGTSRDEFPTINVHNTYAGNVWSRDHDGPGIPIQLPESPPNLIFDAIVDPETAEISFKDPQKHIDFFKFPIEVQNGIREMVMNDFNAQRNPFYEPRYNFTCRPIRNGFQVSCPVGTQGTAGVRVQCSGLAAMNNFPGPDPKSPEEIEEEREREWNQSLGSRSHLEAIGDSISKRYKKAKKWFKKDKDPEDPEKHRPEQPEDDNFTFTDAQGLDYLARYYDNKADRYVRRFPGAYQYQNFLRQRAGAIREHLAHPNIIVEEERNFSPVLLREFPELEKFSSFTGNLVQKQVYDEVCTTLNEFGKLREEFPLQPQLTSAGELMYQSAAMALVQENPAVGFELSDLAFHMGNYGKDFCKLAKEVGICLAKDAVIGLENTAVEVIGFAYNFLSHPVDTTINFVHQNLVFAQKTTTRIVRMAVGDIEAWSRTYHQVNGLLTHYHNRPEEAVAMCVQLILMRKVTGLALDGAQKLAAICNHERLVAAGIGTINISGDLNKRRKIEEILKPVSTTLSGSHAEIVEAQKIVYATQQARDVLANLSKNGQMFITGKKLPISGEFPFVPHKQWIPHKRLHGLAQKEGDVVFFKDIYGNLWKKGGSKTVNRYKDGVQIQRADPFEWDVMLSESAKKTFKHIAKGRNHLNVSPTGKITH